MATVFSLCITGCGNAGGLGASLSNSVGLCSGQEFSWVGEKHWKESQGAGATRWSSAGSKARCHPKAGRLVHAECQKPSNIKLGQKHLPNARGSRITSQEKQTHWHFSDTELLRHRKKQLSLFNFLIYLLGCSRSWLRHLRSSSLLTGPLVAACQLSSCGGGA